jgi:hypothetical protein
MPANIALKHSLKGPNSILSGGAENRDCAARFKTAWDGVWGEMLEGGLDRILRIILRDYGGGCLSEVEVEEGVAGWGKAAAQTLLNVLGEAQMKLDADNPTLTLELDLEAALEKASQHPNNAAAAAVPLREVFTDCEKLLQTSDPRISSCRQAGRIASRLGDRQVVLFGRCIVSALRRACPPTASKVEVKHGTLCKLQRNAATLSIVGLSLRAEAFNSTKSYKAGLRRAVERDEVTARLEEAQREKEEGYKERGRGLADGRDEFAREFSKRQGEKGLALVGEGGEEGGRELGGMGRMCAEWMLKSHDEKLSYKARAEERRKEEWETRIHAREMNLKNREKELTRQAKGAEFMERVRRKAAELDQQIVVAQGGIGAGVKAEYSLKNFCENHNNKHRIEHKHLAYLKSFSSRRYNPGKCLKVVYDIADAADQLNRGKEDAALSTLTALAKHSEFDGNQIKENLRDDNDLIMYCIHPEANSDAHKNTDVLHMIIFLSRNPRGFTSIALKSTYTPAGGKRRFDIPTRTGGMGFVDAELLNQKVGWGVSVWKGGLEFDGDDGAPFVVPELVFFSGPGTHTWEPKKRIGSPNKRSIALNEAGEKKLQGGGEGQGGTGEGAGAGTVGAQSKRELWRIRTQLKAEDVKRINRFRLRLKVVLALWCERLTLS